MNAHPENERPRERAARLLTELLPASEPLLRGVAARHCERLDDAEDAFQEAMVIFVEKFRDDESIAVPWLVTTVKRCAWASARRRRAHPEPSLEGPANGRADQVELGELLPSEDLGPVEAAERRDLTERRLALLAELKPHERECLFLKASGLSYEEIMELKGWTYTKVNRLMAEGRARLRELERELVS